MTDGDSVPESELQPTQPPPPPAAPPNKGLLANQWARYGLAFVLGAALGGGDPTDSSAGHSQLRFGDTFTHATARFASGPDEARCQIVTKDHI